MPAHVPEYAAIIFDLDGVVIDSEPLHEKAQHIIFQRYDLIVPPAAMASFKGLTENVVFDRIVREYATGVLDAAMLVAEKNEAYRGLVHELELVPDVLRFIQCARPHYALALTTSSVRSDQERAFSKFALDAYFDVIVTAEDITRPKPDPEPYDVTVRHLGYAPERCLVIEDSLNGVRAAYRAGCVVAGLTTSFDAAPLREAGAHFTIDRFSELAGRLGLSLDARDLDGRGPTPP